MVLAFDTLTVPWYRQNFSWLPQHDRESHAERGSMPREILFLMPGWIWREVRGGEGRGGGGVVQHSEN